MTNSSRPVVLLVEDNEEISENMAEILEIEGYACWRAATADAALEMLGRQKRGPDAILLDFRLPGMPVEDFVTVIRARPPWSGIPMVLVTAALAAEIPGDLEVDEVIFKPFELDELLDRLGEIVASGRPLKRAGT